MGGCSSHPAVKNHESKERGNGFAASTLISLPFPDGVDLEVNGRNFSGRLETRREKAKSSALLSAQQNPLVLPVDIIDVRNDLKHRKRVNSSDVDNVLVYFTEELEDPYFHRKSPDSKIAQNVNDLSISSFEGDPQLETPLGPACARHNVRILGTGRETIFMSHGFGTNQKVWDGILECLDLVNDFRVILWDLMGAYSTNPEGFNFQRYSTLHGYADDMLEVLDELNEQDVTYIGHSASGMIGTVASIENPQLFKRLILIGASPRYLDKPGYKGGFSSENLGQVFCAMQENYQAWASGFSPMVVGEDVESPSVREFCRSLFLIRPDIALCTLRTIFTSDLRSILPQCKVPVYLLQTARDAAVPWEPVQYMLDKFPEARVEIIQTNGHLPHLTHPKLVAEAIFRQIG